MAFFSLQIVVCNVTRMKQPVETNIVAHRNIGRWPGYFLLLHARNKNVWKRDKPTPYSLINRCINFLQRGVWWIAYISRVHTTWCSPFTLKLRYNASYTLTVLVMTEPRHLALRVHLSWSLYTSQQVFQLKIWSCHCIPVWHSLYFQFTSALVNWKYKLWPKLPLCLAYCTYMYIIYLAIAVFSHTMHSVLPVRC